MSRNATLTGVIIGILAAFAAGCGSGQAAGISEDNPWEALPDDVVAVAHVNATALRTSTLFHRLSSTYDEPAKKTNAQVEEFLAATGFDLEKDVEFATFGAGADFARNEGPIYGIVRGNFDLGRIDEYLSTKAEVVKGEHEGLTTYTSTDEQDKSAPMVAWIDETTMILATRPDFPRFVQSISGSAPGAATTSLANLMTESTGQIHVAVHVPEDVKRDAASNAAGNPMLAGLAEPLQRLETVLFAIDMGDDLRFSMMAEADTAESARLVQETLQGFVSMGKMMAAQNPDAVRFFEQIRLTGHDRTVQLAITVPGDELMDSLGSTAATTISTGAHGG